MTRQATIPDTARVAGGVVLPTLAGGVLKRRPRVMALAELLQLDRPAVGLLRRLHARHGPGPLLLRVPGRSIALVLDAEDVERVLANTPSPFHPASLEKRAALNHFQPHAVLATKSTEREPRRRYNEAVLETGHELHSLAGQTRTVVREETERLLANTTELDWATFNTAWWRIVRRIVFGDGARDEHAVTDELARLRLRANWAYLLPKSKRARQSLHQRIGDLLARAESGSLAAKIAELPTESGIDPAGQVPHWLFAFDAAGMATLRTLALLATHPRQNTDAHADLDDPALSYLRGCVLDTVRLWPTTPVLLRESTTATSWHGTQLPPGTTFFVFTPYFHRDPEAIPFADEFEPQAWLDGRAEQHPALVPFSDGPGRCPGENLVLFVTSTMLAELLRRGDYRLLSPRTLSPQRPLPATLDNFGLRFAVDPKVIAPK
ncbi:cytochrome P450 [Prauserella sp. PE36]|uniref:cytochrome P450 n=1 Tax=Prauserella sp. PE36 TaxID=1504709 RepID=UPI000D9F6F68|nr:cytochrome P450 [Prauserella sp. PE36]PXY35046.1 cytochrome [Prauserella coralliicola]RBM19161.1 cytochrome P450 [Prauserella sp. PE36]